MKKHIISILGIVFWTLIIWLAATYLETRWLDGRIQPPTRYTKEEWIDNFKIWASFSILVAGLASLVWYILGQWIIKIKNKNDSDKRWVWYLLLCFPIIATIMSAIFTKHAQQGAWNAYLCYLLNGLACYYLSTVEFSPSSFKYIPLGASRFRIW